MIEESQISNDFHQILKALRDQWICPISQFVVKDPVLTLDGQLYQRSKIQQWLSVNKSDPTTKNVIQKTLITNRALKNTIRIIQQQLPLLFFKQSIKLKQVDSLNQQIMQLQNQLKAQKQKVKSLQCLLKNTLVNTQKIKKIRKKQQNLKDHKIRKLKQQISLNKNDKIKIYKLERLNSKLKEQIQQIKENKAQILFLKNQINSLKQIISVQEYQIQQLKDQNCQIQEKCSMIQYNQSLVKKQFGGQVKFNLFFIEQLFNMLSQQNNLKNRVQIKLEVFQKLKISCDKHQIFYSSQIQKSEKSMNKEQLNKIKQMLQLTKSYKQKLKVYKGMSMSNISSQIQLACVEHVFNQDFKQVGYSLKSVPYLESRSKLSVQQTRKLQSNQNYIWNRVVKIQLPEQEQLNSYQWKLLVQNANKFPNLTQLQVRNLYGVQIKRQQLQKFQNLQLVTFKQIQLSHQSRGQLDKFRKGNYQRAIILIKQGDSQINN